MKFENLSASYDVGIAKEFGLPSAALLNKLLYLSKSTTREDGFCWRTSKELEDELGITRKQQEIAIKKLEEAGIIETKNTYIIGTQIKCKHFKICDFNKTDKSDFYKRCKSEIDEMCNSVNNNKTIIKDNNNIYSAVIDFLNEKTKQHYKDSTSKTRSLINARVNEGFTLEDFKEVIRKKSNEWLNTKMEIYLRPETLFGTKFESYLNQKGNNLPEWFDKDFDIEENDTDKEYMDELLKNFK